MTIPLYPWLCLITLLFLCGCNVWHSLGRTITTTREPSSALPPAFHDDNDTTTSLPTLSLDWGNLPVLSPLGKVMLDHQSNCTLPVAEFRFRNRFGLGSDLHLWAVALCNAMEQGLRVLTFQQDWIYWDQAHCDSPIMSTLECYFGSAPELTCPVEGDYNTINRPKLYRGLGRISHECPSIEAQYTRSDIFAAAMEVLFANVSPTVIHEAQRQIQLVFGPTGVPSNLITVHIRWGDKADEMELVPIQEYIQAIQMLQAEDTLYSNNEYYSQTTNVFLATEDPRAVAAFRQQAPGDWNIYVDVYFEQFLPHRLDHYNGNPTMAKALQGAPGLVAIASLLVAMEANRFVLTTASNWSRLMDELRRLVVEPRRGPTRMIDLLPQE